MDSKKGIILKVTKKGLVVLGRDGLFYRLPLPAQIPLIGEEVELPSGVQEPPVSLRMKGLFVPSRLRTWALAASILIILVAGVFLFPSHPQAAYVVALDINPSLELYVDDEDRVIRAEALDREAEGLLGRLKLEDLSLAAAIEKITLEAKAEGLLSEEESQVIATVVQWKEELAQEEIEQKVEKQMANLGERDRIVVAFADKETLEQAHDRKLSVARYKIAKELEEKGIPFAKDEIAKAPVGELLKKYGLNPSEVLNGHDSSEEKGSGNQKGTAGKNPGVEKPEEEEKEDEDKEKEDKTISGRERDDEDQENGKKWWSGYKPGNGEEKDRSYRNKEDEDGENGKGSWEDRRKSGDDEDSRDWGDRRNSDDRDKDDNRDHDDDRDQDDDRKKEDEREKKDGKREGERSGDRKSGREDNDDDDD